MLGHPQKVHAKSTIADNKSLEDAKPMKNADQAFPAQSSHLE
jgi:hypothetical protein